MKRREFLKTTAGGAALLPLLASIQAAAPRAGETAPSKPNILLLMADQWRGDALGAAGNKVVRTPNLDALAGAGVLFTAAYTCTPSCCPARAALLTGLSPWHHGVLGAGKIPEHFKFELPQALHDAGYSTFGIGKMHYSPQRALHGFDGTLLDESMRELSPGFVSDYHQWFAQVSGGKKPDATGLGPNDYQSAPFVYPEEWHPTAWTGGEAVKRIRNEEGKRPFFLKVSFARPHSPYDAPPRFMEMYREEDMPAPTVGEWAARYAAPDDPVPSDAWHGDLGLAQARKSRRGYYGNITFIDEQIGKIVQALKDKGLYDNTLILFTADHGDMLGDHNLWRKTYAYEGSARIPMIVRWPKSMGLDAMRGGKPDQPAELRDVLPTFLEAAGVAAPKYLDGASLLGPIRDRKAQWREFIDLEHSRCYKDCPFWVGLTDGKWKFIYFPGEDAAQLFDLQNDPGEKRNLADDPAHAATLKTWRGRMVEHLAERGAPWVKDGKLSPHPDSAIRSPFYDKGYPA